MRGMEVLEPDIYLRTSIQQEEVMWIKNLHKFESITRWWITQVDWNGNFHLGISGSAITTTTVGRQHTKMEQQQINERP